MSCCARVISPTAWLFCCSFCKPRMTLPWNEYSMSLCCYRCVHSASFIVADLRQCGLTAPQVCGKPLHVAAGSLLFCRAAGDQSFQALLSCLSVDIKTLLGNSCPQCDVGAPLQPACTCTGSQSSVPCPVHLYTCCSLITENLEKSTSP